jgi:hypothetical protein
MVSVDRFSIEHNFKSEASTMSAIKQISRLDIGKVSHFSLGHKTWNIASDMER